MLSRPEWMAGSIADTDASDALRRVHIRPVQADDADAVDHFVRSLSLRSRQRRFHVGIRELSPAALARFTRPDNRYERVLIATVADQGRVWCIGEARYAVEPQVPGAREFAIAIADGWQRRGLGRLMLCSLMVEALGQGVSTLCGDVLHDNLPMLALAESMGFARHRHPGDAGLIRVVHALDRGVASTLSPCTRRLAPLPLAA